MSDKVTQVALDEFLGAENSSPNAKYKRWVRLMLAVAAVLFVGWLIFGGKETARGYATGPVTRGNLMVQVTATGNLAPTNEIAIGSELSGIVDRVFVDVNDRVDKGQPLVQLDTSRLRDTLASSKAAVDQANAGVGQAQATVQQSAADLARFNNVFALSGGKVPSRSELDKAKADHTRAIANFNAARAQLASARAQYSSDQTNLGKATIRSPVTGVVLSRQIEPGQTVAASFNTPTFFKIAEDLSAMELVVKVDEADVGQVAPDQPATFAVDAFPGRRFPALIQRVDVGSNTATGTTTTSSTVVSYNAVLTVNNPDLVLRPGMTATAEITTSEERNVLLVPNASLRFKPTALANEEGFSIFGPGDNKTQQAKITRGTKQTLYVLGTEGELRRVWVIAGDSNGTSTIILGGNLKVGEKVITGELATKE